MIGQVLGYGLRHLSFEYSYEYYYYTVTEILHRNFHMKFPVSQLKSLIFQYDYFTYAGLYQSRAFLSVLLGSCHVLEKLSLPWFDLGLNFQNIAQNGCYLKVLHVGHLNLEAAKLIVNNCTELSELALTSRNMYVLIKNDYFVFYHISNND